VPQSTLLVPHIQPGCMYARWCGLLPARSVPHAVLYPAGAVWLGVPDTHMQGLC
jgi:hypothetical protein